MSVISVNGKALPSPVEVSIEDEIIWSSDSGRDLSGLFAGDVIADKKTISVVWGVLSASDVNTIQSNLASGYIPVTFQDASGNVTIDAYRGTLSKVLLGTFGGVTWYKSVSCKIIQR